MPQYPVYTCYSLFLLMLWVFSNYFNISSQSKLHSVSVSTSGLNLSLHSSAKYAPLCKSHPRPLSNPPLHTVEGLCYLDSTAPYMYTKVVILFCAPKHFLHILLITVSTNTMVNCLRACLFQWAASWLIHLCVLSTYQGQAHGWYALTVLSIELNTVKHFPFTHPR